MILSKELLTKCSIITNLLQQINLKILEEADEYTQSKSEYF